MMKIEKPGKSAKELLAGLDNLKAQFAPQIEQFDLKVSSIPDGYNLKGNKKFLLFDFSVNIDIHAKDEQYIINYETKNVPQSKIDEALVQVKEVLNNV